MWYDAQPSALRQAVQISLESYHSGEEYHEHQECLNIYCC